MAVSRTFCIPTASSRRN